MKRVFALHATGSIVLFFSTSFTQLWIIIYIYLVITRMRHFAAKRILTRFRERNIYRNVWRSQSYTFSWETFRIFFCSFRFFFPMCHLPLYLLRKQSPRRTCTLLESASNFSFPSFSLLMCQSIKKMYNDDGDNNDDCSFRTSLWRNTRSVFLLRVF